MWTDKVCTFCPDSGLNLPKVVQGGESMEPATDQNNNDELKEQPKE